MAAGSAGTAGSSRRSRRHSEKALPSAQTAIATANAPGTADAIPLRFRWVEAYADKP